MEVIVRNETDRADISGMEELVLKCARQALAYQERRGGEGERPPCGWRPKTIDEVEGEVSITLTGNEEIREMNAAYRGKDVPTDVLSFPMDPDWDESYVLLGDVVISLERAEEQARDYGHSLNREVGFLTVHGMLHLLGYDHEHPADAAVMESCQEEILAEVELPR